MLEIQPQSSPRSQPTRNTSIFELFLLSTLRSKQHLWDLRESMTKPHGERSEAEGN
jgi:hypothetical protein